MLLKSPIRYSPAAAFPITRLFLNFAAVRSKGRASSGSKVHSASTALAWTRTSGSNKSRPTRAALLLVLAMSRAACDRTPESG